MTQIITTKIPNRHGLNIAVLVEIPENPRGLMFIVHGWNSSKSSNSARTIAEAALANQVIAVRLDCTHSSGESDGSLEHSSVTTYVADLADVIDWAKTQPWFQTPYILIGSSFGGLAVLDQGYKNRHEVLAMGLLAPVVSGKLYVEALEKRLPGVLASWQETGFWEVETDSRGTVKIPLSHLEDRITYDPLIYAGELKMPVLICVGDKDNTCPLYQQQILLAALGSADKELHVFDDFGHGVKDKAHLQQLGSCFSDWLAKII